MLVALPRAPTVAAVVFQGEYPVAAPHSVPWENLMMLLNLVTKVERRSRVSVKVSQMVWHSRLPPHEKLTALAMADHADADGRNIRPGIARLAAMTGKDPRTVQRDVSALIKKNLLVPLTPRRGHGGRPTHYELNLDVLALLGRTSQDDPESHDEQEAVSTDDRRERLATTTLASPDGDADVTRSVMNDHDPSEESSGLRRFTRSI